MFIDTGSSGGEGPWISWSARGTQDGAIPAQSFYLREEGGNKEVFEGFAKGVVFDADSLKTGWQRSDGIVGVAPDWRWNASPDRFEPSPGDDYKKGFHVRMAIGGGKTATWEQAGAGAWNALVSIAPALNQRPAGKHPLVKLVRVEVQKFSRGSTSTPILEVVKWVDLPECLAAPGIDTGAAQPVQSAPAPQPAPEPAMADDMEF